MNRILIFPLTFLFLLILFATVYTGETYSSDSTENYSSFDGVNMSGEEGYVDIPEGGEFEFNIWDTATIAGAVVILTAAVAVGILAGINVLGSGLSETSQKMIFTGILFGGLWACLSVVASDFMFVNWLTEMIWVALTIMYIIGVGTIISGNGE